MNMSKYTKKYIHEFCLEKEDKKRLLDVFRNNEITKSTECSKMLRITHYSKPVYVYNTKYKEELEEVRKLPLGVVDFWDLLSSKCQGLINDYYFKQYNLESKFKFTYLFDNEHSGENAYIESKLSRISEFAKLNDLDVFTDNDSLDVDFLSEVFYKNRLINNARVRNQVIVYAIKEKDYSLIDLDVDGNLILTDKALNRYINDLELVPLTIDERLRKSVSQTYCAFKDLCFTNADKFEYFITLTFAEESEKEKHLLLNENKKIDDVDVKFKYIDDVKDYEKCVKAMTKFLHRMKINLSRKDIEFYYLGVPEYQKNGNIHYHFLMSKFPDEFLYKNPSWADRDYNTNKILNSYGLKMWDYGLSNVAFIKDKARCSTYISKYMQKSLKEIDETMYIDRLNKKRFYRSNNLEVPKVSYGYVDESSIEYLSLYESSKFDVFSSSFIFTSQYILEEM